MKYIPLAIADTYVQGDHIIIGAEGGHDETALEITFSAHWNGLSKVAYWLSADLSLSEGMPITIDMQVPGRPDTYHLPVPYTAKAAPGKSTLTVKGYGISGDKESKAIYSVDAVFSVLENNFPHALPEMSPTDAERLQAEIDLLEKNKQNWRTVKLSKIPGVTDAASLHAWVNANHKGADRIFLIESGSEGWGDLINALESIPSGVDTEASAFVLLEIPYSEAGPLTLVVRYVLRKSVGIWKRTEYATYSTPSPTWLKTEWVAERDVQQTKVSDLENDLKFQESQTMVIKERLMLDGTPVSTREELRTYFYNLRKSTQRRFQFEYSTDGVNSYLADILGIPPGASKLDRAFIYVDIPFSEAGGFEIRYRWQLGSKNGIWDMAEYSTLNSAWQSSGWMPQKSIPEVEMASTRARLHPNVFFVWGEVTSLEISLAPGEPGAVSEYHFSFGSGAVPTTLDVPGDIKWVSPPVIEANKTYEVSILNGIGVIVGA